MQENELLEKIKAGDFHSFKLLFEEYKNPIYNLCYRFVDSEEEAEDLCQDVFLKVFKAAKTFQQKSKVSTWMYRITVNLCLNYKRKHHKFTWLSIDQQSEKTNQELESALSISGPVRPDHSLEKKEREQIVQNAINSLPKNQRVALLLQRYEGMSVQEIAGIVDCSVSSIQSRLARAKENLAKQLEPFLEEI